MKLTGEPVRRRFTLLVLAALVAVILPPGISKLAPRLAFAASYSSTVLGDGPVAYWRLDESSGTTAADSSGSGNGGTYTGGYSFRQPGAIVGDSDTATNFGTTGYVDVNQSSSLKPTAALSVEGLD